MKNDKIPKKKFRHFEHEQLQNKSDGNENYSSSNNDDKDGSNYRSTIK